MSLAPPWDIMRAQGREPCCSSSLHRRVAMSSFHSSLAGSSTLKVSSYYQTRHERPCLFVTKMGDWANAFALLVRLQLM